MKKNNISRDKPKNKPEHNTKMTVKPRFPTKVSDSFIPLDNPEKPLREGKNGKRSRPKKTRAHKKPRLIVRNLNYKATEESVRKHFESFGEVTDVVLLRKPNQQLVGCGFVQFSRAQSAAQAIAKASGQQFMGRPIVVDWAVPKDQFLKKSESSGSSNIKVEVKEEEDDSNDNKKDSKGKEKLNNVISLDEDDSEDEEDEDDDKDDKADIKFDNDNSDEDDDDDDDDDDDNDEDDKDSGPGKRKKFEDKKPRFESNDVSEGRTVFLRNLPFSIDNDKLHDFGEQFGPVVYAVVCKDARSDHSRGTGFIKFQNAETATQCIAQSQSKELVIENRTIDVTPAISRNDAKKVLIKEKVPKDNRNLYLLKEGLITANSPASEGVSPSDMEKRIYLERWKTKTLRDLTMFVSRVRLVIHNLPPSYDDAQLRAVFLKHGGFKPRITESKVMRNLKNVDASGVGQSKEYGFVTFTNHENALEALRNVNNNPKIFGPNKRPIVSFSIEDKKKLNIRKRREERSLMKNPTWKHYKKEESEAENLRNKKMHNKKGAGKTSNAEKSEVGKKRKNSAQPGGPAAKVPRPFMGAEAKHGEGGTIPLRKLRDQSEIVRQNAKDKKKQTRQKKKPERIKQAKQEKKERESKDNFSDLVDKYKSSLSSASVPRSKWYE